jgi:hypothetical protein
VFGSTEPLWAHAEEGDVLLVTLNAQFPGWENYAQQGILQVDTWWQPSTAMMNLICNKQI